MMPVTSQEPERRVQWDGNGALAPNLPHLSAKSFASIGTSILPDLCRCPLPLNEPSLNSHFFHACFSETIDRRDFPVGAACWGCTGTGESFVGSIQRFADGVR